MHARSGIPRDSGIGPRILTGSDGQPEIGGMLQSLLSGAAQTAGVGGMQ